MNNKQIESIKANCIKSGCGIYDTKIYRYDLRPDGLYRTRLDNLDTTAMLDPDAWEYVAITKDGDAI